MRARGRACAARTVSQPPTPLPSEPMLAFHRARRENVMPGGNGRRVAVVAGCRTPFCRAGTVLKDVRAVDLARLAARELVHRTNLDGAEVDQVIWGQVVPSALVPNVGREVSLLPQFPKEIPAYSLNRACASANQAVTAAYDQIVLGHADVILAGGVESLSDIPILASRRLADILVEASKAKTALQRVRGFAKIRPRDLIPGSPAIAEASTGGTMGQSAQEMGQENRNSREGPRRELLAPHGRRLGGAPDERRGGPGPGVRAARLRALLRGRRGGSWVATAAGAGVHGAPGAGAGRRRVEGPGADRDPRGVRRAGALQPEGLRGAGLGDQ